MPAVPHTLDLKAAVSFESLQVGQITPYGIHYPITVRYDPTILITDVVILNILVPPEEEWWIRDLTVDTLVIGFDFFRMFAIPTRARLFDDDDPGLGWQPGVPASSPTVRNVAGLEPGAAETEWHLQDGESPPPSLNGTLGQLVAPYFAPDDIISMQLSGASAGGDPAATFGFNLYRRPYKGIFDGRFQDLPT